MSVNLWGGIRTGVAQGSTAKRQTASKTSEVKSEFRSMFEAQKEAATKVESKDGDTLTISYKDTVTQKLGELKKIHEQTDYSGMTDVEKYRMITDRYDEVFPCGAGSIRLNFDKYESVGKQLREELIETIPGYPYADKYGKGTYSDFLKEVRGYQGMSNLDIIEKTKEKYTNNDSLTEKVQIMKELRALNVISEDSYAIFDGSLVYLERQQYKDTFNVTNVNEQSNHYKNWLKNGGMENLKVGWGQLRDNLFQNIDVKKLYGEEKEKELKDLFEILEGK